MTTTHLPRHYVLSIRGEGQSAQRLPGDKERGSIEGGQPDPSLAVLTALGAPLAPKRPGEVSEHSSLEPVL